MASSGNFCVMNPLNWDTMTFSHGNLRISTTTNYKTVFGTIAIPSTGKWYFEVLMVDYANGGSWIGVSNNNYLVHSDQTIADGVFSGTYDGTTQSQGSAITGYGSQGNNFASDGDVFSYAIDMDNQKFYVARNNTYYNSGNPSSGSNGGDISAIFTNAVSTFHPAIVRGNSYNEIYHFNFGQDSTFSGEKTAGGNADSEGFGDFLYSVPTGFKALCSANLPISDDIDPAQTDDNIPTKQCGAFKYTGSNGSAVTVSTGFQPDLIWIKSIDSTDNHYLQDSSRGFGNSKSLSPNSTGQQGYNGGAPSSSGAQNVGSSSFQAYGSDWSRDTDNMIAWTWRANGGTTASNSNGQTTSTVQANQEAGFSIVEYAGTLTGSGTKTIGHGLSKAPELIIIKNPNKTGRWFIQHTGLTNWNYYISFNTNTGETNSSGNGSMSAPTNTVFYTNWTEGSNENPYNHVAYCWHSVEGYSKFGKYTGNSDSDGPFIYTGFRPAIIIIKGLVTGSGWVIKDDTLDGFNPGTGILEPNQNSAKYTTAGGVCDILSNGFKVRTNNAVANSTSYDPYVYMAWGSVPFRYNNTF